MAKSIRDIPKKQRGRPSTGGRREGVMVRLQPAQFEALDDWIKKHDVESRPEAIRRLVEIGLKAKTKERPKSEGTKQRQETKQRARVLASAAVDEMVDTRASADDQASRKRRLIKGPEEFQNVRRDRPNRT